MCDVIVHYSNLIYWQVICFESLCLEQVTSKYSERQYLCLNNYHCKMNSKFNQLIHGLNVVQSTLGYQYDSVTLYVLQTCTHCFLLVVGCFMNFRCFRSFCTA